MRKAPDFNVALVTLALLRSFLPSHLHSRELHDIYNSTLRGGRKMNPVESPKPRVDVVLDKDQWAGLASQAAGVTLPAHDDYIDDEEAETLLSDTALRQWSAVTRVSPNNELTHKSELVSHTMSELSQSATGQYDLVQTSDAVEATRARYQSIRVNEGLYKLLRVALKEEVDMYKTLHGVGLPWILGIGYQVIVSTHPEILDALIRGNVARTYARDQTFKRLLDKIRDHERDRGRPAVYLNQIADARGNSPTPNDILHLIPHLVGYVKGTDPAYVAQIDRKNNNTSPKVSQTQGHQYPRYMCTTHDISSTRQSKTLAFLKALELRCRSVQGNAMDLPLSGCIPELGYTHATEKRLKNHRSHHRSNYMMNLFERALDLKWPQRFSVQQFIVFVCTDAAQAVLAEIIFTRLSLGYTGNGGGFTHYPPGLSNDSARRYHTEEWESWWDWTEKVCHIQENDEKEQTMWAKAREERAHSLSKLREKEEEIAQMRAGVSEAGRDRLNTMFRSELIALQDGMEAQFEEEAEDKVNEMEALLCGIDVVSDFATEWAHCVKKTGYATNG